MLRHRGVGSETTVAVCLGYSERLLVGLLAVLKAGGAYVPLEPSLPDRRLRQLVAQAGCRTVLVDGGTLTRFDAGEVDLVDIDQMPAEAVTAGGSNLRSGVRSDNLAYVVFTSGSTGTPKGVVLPHRAVVNYLRWSNAAYGVGGGQGCLVHSSVAFDLTVTSLFAPLLDGGVVAIDESWQDIGALTRELAHFVQCVRTGSRPRVSGEDGRDAVALACRVLDSVAQHQWEGRPDGPTGPSNMPAPLGRLIDRDERAAA